MIIFYVCSVYILSLVYRFEMEWKAFVPMKIIIDIIIIMK